MATEIKSTSIKSQNIIAEPQANKPGSPEQGQIIQATGTGDIAKGIYQYSGASWVSLDNAQGDLETLRLIMSTDTDAVGFSSALNSTSTLAGNTNAVPHETSTGTGLLGALEIPSTGGDALLTEFDANKVFRYYSAGANNNNDYFGIPVDIPAQTRGQNIVIKFKYRTEEASAASSNGDFQVSVWDKTNGVSTTQASTLTTGTTIAAGSNILMTAKTNLAVGDKIWFETGGTGSTVGGVTNSLTQAYITSISSTDNNITVSEDVQVIALGKAVTGWLTSNTQGLMPAADSDTNKVGKDFSIAVKTEEDTEQVVVWFSNKSVTTNVIELFFDGILVSQNKFLQASSQLKKESYSAYYQDNFWGASTGTQTEWDSTKLVASGGTPPLAQSRMLDIKLESGETRIYAKQNILLNVSADGYSGNGGIIEILDSSDNPIVQRKGTNSSNAGDGPVSTFIKLAKNDYIYFKLQSSGDHKGSCQLVAELDASDVILLESQDEIFTDWVDAGSFSSHVSTVATTTAPTFGTRNPDKYYWRRDGSDMLIRFEYQQSTAGTAGTGSYTISLPDGYSADLSKMTPYSAENTHTSQYIQPGSGYLGVVFGGTDTVGYTIFGNGILFDATTLRVGCFFHGGPASGWWSGAHGANAFNSTTMGVTGLLRVPIAGWNSNFNPLLSMPLVDVGRDTESLTLQDPIGATASSSQRVCYATVLDDTDYSGDLFTYDNNTTTGLKITFNQNVDADVNFGAIATSSQWMGINKNYDSATTGAISVPTANTLAFGNTGPANVRTLPYSGKFKAGDYLHFHCAINTTSSDGDRVTFSITARKDRGNTNMAHIIKPAVAIIQDEKPSNTASGEATAGSWGTRDLTVIKGESWFVTLDTNKFTLEPGTYEIFATAPFYKCEEIQLRLYDVTNSVATDYGQIQYARSANYGTVTTNLMAYKNITSSTEFRLEYYVGSTMATNGLGAGANSWGGTMVYAQVKIRKLK